MNLSIKIPELPIEGKWKSITYPRIKDQSIKPQLADAVYVRHELEPDADKGEAVKGYEALIEEGKGQAVFGWALSEYRLPDTNFRIIEATPRAVFKSLDGDMVDLTFSQNADKTRTCFIPTTQHWKHLPNSQFFLEKRAGERQEEALTYMLATTYLLDVMKAEGVQIVNKNVALQIAQKYARDLDPNLLTRSIMKELKNRDLMIKQRQAALSEFLRRNEEAEAEAKGGEAVSPVAEEASEASSPVAAQEESE